MSNLVKRITGKSIWVNILAAIGILVVLLILFFQFIRMAYGLWESGESAIGNRTKRAGRPTDTASQRI